MARTRVASGAMGGPRWFLETGLSTPLCGGEGLAGSSDLGRPHRTCSAWTRGWAQQIYGADTVPEPHFVGGPRPTSSLPLRPCSERVRLARRRCSGDGHRPSPAKPPRYRARRMVRCEAPTHLGRRPARHRARPHPDGVPPQPHRARDAIHGGQAASQNRTHRPVNPPRKRLGRSARGPGLGGELGLNQASFGDSRHRPMPHDRPGRAPPGA